MRSTNEIKFIHLSDIHMLKDYAGSLMESVIKSGEAQPEDLFRDALAHISTKYQDIDFIIITGDLTHEGKKEDYTYFKEVLDAGRGNIPAFVAMGNHDDCEGFWSGYLSEENVGAEYYYTVEVNGFRIIVLDSSGDKKGQGVISRRQIEWLREIVRQKAQNGSLLFLHHPAVIDLDEDMLCHCLENSQELYNAIHSSDILAIFSGHKHHNSVTMLGHIPQFTADSLGYGVLFDKHMMRITDRHGFSYCVIQNKQIYVTHERFPENDKVVAQVPMDELMAHWLERHTE